jgi:hypothetical protein
MVGLAILSSPDRRAEPSSSVPWGYDHILIGGSCGTQGKLQEAIHTVTYSLRARSTDKGAHNQTLGDDSLGTLSLNWRGLRCVVEDRLADFYDWNGFSASALRGSGIWPPFTWKVT